MKKNKKMAKLNFYFPVKFPDNKKQLKHKIAYPRIQASAKKAIYLIEKYATKLNLINIKIFTNYSIDEYGNTTRQNNGGPDAAMYFQYKNDDKWYVITASRYFRLRENLFSIAKVLEGYAIIKKEKTNALEIQFENQNQ